MSDLDKKYDGKLKTIAFVAPWYGDNIPGGAEADMRGLAKHLNARGVDLEILTTCVKEFTAEWDENYHEPGLTEEGGLKVRRFPVRKRDRILFDRINYRLMQGQYLITSRDEKTFLDENVNSPELYEYIKTHKDDYSVFVFIPYLFATTYYGAKQCPEKSVLIPCFHDEPYVYFSHFKDMYSRVKGMAFHARPEYDLVCGIYDMSNVKALIVGGGLDTGLTYDADRFREKYDIKDPFILYAGRKDVGKNVYTLIDYFREYKKRMAETTGVSEKPDLSGLKLVFLGGGDLKIPEECKDEILDLGFVPVQDKYDAYAAAGFTCQPSKNESFSIVIMESWLCKRPVMVCEDCAVTTNFVKESNGGLYFKNYFDFEAATTFLLTHKEEAAQMADNGDRYVRNNFDWEVVTDRYIQFFEEIAGI